MQIRQFVFKPTLVPTLAFLLLLPILISLGFWQLDRAEEKRAIEAAVLAASQKVALLLNDVTPSIVGKEIYRPAKMSGRYNNQRQYLWDNKTHQGRPGFQVLTPFILEGSDQLVMINRGWVAMLASRDQLPDIFVGSDQISVEGVIKNPSNTIQLADDIDQQGRPYPRVIQAFDTEAIASELKSPVMPVLIELSPEAAEGYVRDWQPYYGKIGKHIGYAAQWFIMALIAVFLYVKLNTKRIESSVAL